MSDQITITLTKEQAKEIEAFCTRSNRMWNLLWFYSEMLENINHDAPLSLSGWIVLTETLKEASDLIREGTQEALGVVFCQLPKGPA